MHSRLARFAALLSLFVAFGGHALAQEPAACGATDPNLRPVRARPYFLVVADSSTAMATDVGLPSSCATGNTRLAHERCALRTAFANYAGSINFGLGTFAETQSACAAACTCNVGDASCFAACTYACAPAEMTTRGTCVGCGARPSGASTASGLWLRAPIFADSFWFAVPPPSNLMVLLPWVDGTCGGNTELFARGMRPLNGSLRDVARYFRSSLTAPDGMTFNTPLDAMDRACRSVNVILLTSGDETCDTQADVVAAAQDLFVNGATVGGRTFAIRVHVINFAGATQSNTDAIAAAGGTTTSYFATNETQLGQALDAILGSALVPETCDNVDNDCNGCTDDGFAHYCDQGQACCAWGTNAQRTACLTTFRSTITPATPLGSRALLPCTTAVQGMQPATWLCYAPGDTCDGIDNDCAGGSDDGVTRCGSPSHCPTAETCNAQDEDCDGLIDEGACVGCAPTSEICDGCDNDCDGMVDDGISTLIPCGSGAPNCIGTMGCRAPVSVVPGGCVAGGGYTACSNAPQPESCNGADDDCNGIADDVTSVSCLPPSAPPGLVFGPFGTCRRGTTRCSGGTSSCLGFVGPTSEVCDGLDQDCDGRVDEMSAGIGAACGGTHGCSPGTTACISGAIVCSGSTGGTPERCDGVDNDCNGVVDDGRLADGPAPGANGCWNLPGNCCSFGGALTWCPPSGATCQDGGGLAAPCSAGTLACVTGAWQCVGGRAPSRETCNGIDDDCTGATDDGVLASPIGDACGASVGRCSVGVTTCALGETSCSGVGPTIETCNAEDDDCDGTTDESLGGGACTAPYDTIAFPGARTSGVCRGGTLACVGSAMSCAGSVAPGAEVCNGRDDDCDGSVDETGTAPDGIDGSASPDDATHIVGASCGGATACGAAYACAEARVTCVTATAHPETCNCLDDDCDGSVDENGTSLCGAAGACAAVSAGVCACAASCTVTGDCPVGDACESATESGTGSALGLACLPDACGDCSTRWIEASGMVACAPAGTELAGCITPPVCACTASGCGSPCEGVTCTAGLACAERGPMAGTCITPHCPEVPCNACGTVCSPSGTCVDDPCDPSPCAAGSTCVPSADLSGHTCTSVDAGTADAGARDAGTAMDAGGDGGGAVTSAGGCGCTVPSQRGDARGALAILALALLGLARRRRRLAALALASAMIAGCPGPSTIEDGGSDASAMDARVDALVLDGAAVDAPSVDGARADACVPATEVCNGRDDDCDGTADDVDTHALATCGGCGHDCNVLAFGCARDGVTCDGAACGCSHCAPGLRDLDGDGSCEATCSPSTAPDDQCDGIDDDCDGTRDEDANLCAAPNCGGCGNTCSPLHGAGECQVSGTHCASDARCVVLSCECTGPGHCWHDLDGDPHTGCEYACDITNGGVEICDGHDDDCDGNVDEDPSADTRVGVACNGGVLGLCAAAAHAGVTACRAGAIACEGGSVLAPGTVAETCNAIDDDCDGRTDESASDAGGTCGTSSIAPCALGRLVCSAGALSCVGAIAPGTETCNGRDDDCNGTIDDGLAIVGTVCGTFAAPPTGAATACATGTYACTSGVLVCAGAMGPVSGAIDTCGVDADCDGRLVNQPDLANDPANCHACGASCYAGSIHADWTCGTAGCVFAGCQPGYYDLDGDHHCEYPCTFLSSNEACNGVDDNCNGTIDEAVVAPPATAVCGISPSATRPECTSAVTVSCMSGAWRCAFPAGVCSGSCASATEVCDGLDNDCDGLLNENVANFGAPCASDDGLPAPGHGACRTTGTYACNSPSTVVCSAVRASCSGLPGGCTELCDGIDNDCDGATDEPFTARGTDAANFVRPAVTQIATSVWMYSFEATRPGATSGSQGLGNGYQTSAPAGITLDRTRSCSVQGRLPWTNVTGTEAVQTCTAMGGTLCSPTTWQSACSATTPCTWGYAPRGATCMAPYSPTVFCNLGPSFDSDGSAPGDQDGMVVTGSSALRQCFADWSALFGNTAATNRIFDITGNVRELVLVGANVFRAVGGGYATIEEGAMCSTPGPAFDQTLREPDLGFRCCFTSNPTL